MDTHNYTLDKIELRSEKVHKLLGEILPIISTLGASNYASYFIALLAVVCYCLFHVQMRNL